MSEQQVKRRRSAVAELKILHRIIETISYNLDFDSVLKEIIHLVDTVAHADEIFIYLLQDNVLSCRAAKREVPHEWKKIHLRVGTGITGWVAQHRTPVVIPLHASHDSRFHVFTNLQADQFEAFCSLPLIHHEKLVGVFNVQHKNEYHFTKNDIALLRTIAMATAGAVETARLFDQTNFLQEALAARKLIEKAKGKLMKHYHIDEGEAYDIIKKRAMDLRKPMRDIANAILLIPEK